MGRVIAGETWPAPEVFGGSPVGSYSSLGPGIQVYECWFRGLDEGSVRFPFDCKEIVHCPSGLEATPIRIPMGLLRKEITRLPLANGLVQLTPDLFLVKDKAYVHVAASIDTRGAQLIEFGVYGPNPGRWYHWRFYLVSTTLAEAVAVANLVNCV